MPTLYGVVWKKHDGGFKMESPVGATLEDAKSIQRVAQLTYPSFEFQVVEMRFVE